MATKAIVGEKVGMTQIWDEQHRAIPVTVVRVAPVRVVQLKTPERDGYAAVQLSFGAIKAERLTKPALGHLKVADAEPARHLAELTVDDLSGYEVGQVIAADVFGAGERVDVTGISKGKGFTGAMVRHSRSARADARSANRCCTSSRVRLPTSKRGTNAART